MKKYSLVKFISFLICITFLISALFGCGTNTNNTKTTSSTNVSNTTNATTTQAEAKKITLNLYAWGKLYTGTNDDAYISNLTKQFGKKYNVDLTIKFANDPDGTKLPLLMASNAIDAFNVGWEPKVETYMRQDGLLQPLDDLLNKYGPNILKGTPEGEWKYTKINGATMMLPFISPYPTYNINCIRKDLLDKAGLAMPTTYDEWVNALLKLKDMGVEFPTLAWDYWPAMMGLFKPADERDANGNAKPALVSYMSVFYRDPAYRDGLKKVRDLYAKGIYKAETNSWNWDKIKQMAQAGKVGCIPFSITDSAFLDQMKSQNNQDWEPITSLKDSNGNELGWSYGPQPCRVIGILKSSKNPDAIIQFYDWVNSDINNYLSTEYGVEGTNWQWVEKDKSYKVLTDSNNTITDYMYNFWDLKLLQVKAQDMLAKNDSNILYEAVKNYKGLTYVDEGYAYELPKTFSKLADFNKIQQEYEGKIIAGTLPVDQGVDEMLKALDAAGIKDYENERNQEFLKVFGTGK